MKSYHRYRTTHTAKQNTIRLLQEACEAPPPLRRDSFIQALPNRKISTLAFLRFQVGYIPKWIWGMSAVIFVLALAAACLLEQDILQILSAVIPFVAIASGIESGRSHIYAMAELEMSSRFSLKSVILARMGILGLSHLLLLAALIPLGTLHNTAGFLQTGVYLLTPYLAATLTGLWISRKIRGKEAGYAYLGTAVFISGFLMYIQAALPDCYQTRHFHRWGILLVLLAGAVIYEFTKIIQETEELEWNLS
ncbi:hypothetical protein [Sporofaciens sp. JLR.KK001]|uniref:hypothetical protein n=1 Tax=Sporofaciens sp. JLR.KK001 TaxID=3112621 RepID=UPI002FF27B7A